MEPLSSLLTEFAFGRKDYNDAAAEKEPDDKGLKLMGPDYVGYLRRQRENLALLSVQKFRIMNIVSEDGLKLTGRLYINENTDSHITAVMVHGYGSNGLKGAASIGLNFIAHGYNIFVTDNRASGDSEGKYMTFGIMESRDTARWLEVLSKERPDDTFFLLGVSLGGSTVCDMASMKLNAPVRAIVSDCGFESIRSEFSFYASEYYHVPPKIMLPLLEKGFRESTGLDFDIANPITSVASTALPMLFIHGKEDEYVPCPHSDHLYAACSSPKKKLLQIDGAGHASAERFGRDLYYGTIYDFIENA